VHYYYSDQKTEIVDAVFVNQLFGSKEVLLADLAAVGTKELSVRMTKHGDSPFGSIKFLIRTRDQPGTVFWVFSFLYL
jgi:hypothetical protein